MQRLGTKPWSQVFVMLAIMASAWSGYQLQNDDLDELRGEVDSLRQQVADISRELSPGSEYGQSVNEFRTLRVFLFVEGGCDSALVGPRSLYLSDNLNPESRRFYASSFQGRFPSTEGREVKCINEYLFYSAPLANEYYVTDSLLARGLITGLSWTLNAQGEGDYIEVSLEY